jgi:hypothetical protein
LKVKTLITLKFLARPAIVVILVVAAVLCSSGDSFGQQQRRLIQLSGVAIDTAEGPVPGVHIYVPKAGRGTRTNGVGFFSMPVVVGDSIVISSIGYRTRHMIVPENADEYTTIVISMVQDVTYLDEVVIVPYPTEEVFKEAILALNLPDSKIDEKNMQAELLALMVKTTPMNGPQNQRYYLNQWAASQNDRYMAVTNPFLNPFNWVKFFSGLKNNKKK